MPALDISWFSPRCARAESRGSAGSTRSLVQALTNKRVLQARGYRPFSFQHPLREKYYRRVSHHWEFHHPERRLHLELHQTLLPRSRSSRIEPTGLWQRAQTQTLSGRPFAVMDAGDLLLYLVIHGAKEHWSTLLHLYDVAAWLVRYPQADWQAIRQRAEQWRCRRRLRIALALTCSLFRVPLPPPFESELQRNKDFIPLYHQVLERLFFASKPIRKIHLFRVGLDWRLADGWRDLPALLACKGANRLVAAATWRPGVKQHGPTGRNLD